MQPPSDKASDQLQDQLQTALEGRYAIERRVGAGGMAFVYLATDLRHRRRVAVDAEESFVLARSEAAAALVARPWEDSAPLEWAVARNLGVRVDGWYVALVVGTPELLAEFEQERTPVAREVVTAERSRTG